MGPDVFRVPACRARRAWPCLLGSKCFIWMTGAAAPGRVPLCSGGQPCLRRERHGARTAQGRCAVPRPVAPTTLSQQLMQIKTARRCLGG